MAPKLVDGEEMYPIRGHVIRVRAPWVRQYTNKDKDIYIIPNTGEARGPHTTPGPRRQQRHAVGEGGRIAWLGF